MPVTNEFNDSATPKNYQLIAHNDHVIEATVLNRNGYGVHTVTYDFLNRLVMAPNDKTYTFAEYDEGAIEWHYNKLVEQGRKPRPPAHMTDTKPAPAQRKLQA